MGTCATRFGTGNGDTGYGAKRKNLAARLSLAERAGKEMLYKDGIRERQELQ